ncbi:MAG: hypothetical protein MUC63_03760 [Planctomycetes bacterium]|jgi:hypothetical protein|nr:hypothetical protein [Planctomycetota bacterium]
MGIEPRSEPGKPAALRAAAAATAVLVLAGVLAGCRLGAAERTPVAEASLRERAGRSLEESRLHLLPEGLLVYRMDWPDSLETRYRRASAQADGAYFQGLYVAVLCQRAALTGKPEDREEALRAYRALRLLMRWSGYEGLVARTFGKPEPGARSYRVRDDSSGDQVTGFVWGTYWALALLDEPEVRQGAAADTRALVGHLRRHGLKVHRRAGEPTPYGEYDVDVLGVLPIGHRAVGALAIALVARLANPDDAECGEFFDELVRRDYHRKARWFYSWFPHSAANTVNFLLNLFLAWRLDDAPHRRAFYAEARDAAWDVSHGWQMALYAALVQAMGGAGHPEDRVDALARLRNLPDRHAWFTDESVSWRLSVVPLERRPSSTSYWSCSAQRELTGRAEGEEPVRIARVDFLAAYWFGRWAGIYREDE